MGRSSGSPRNPEQQIPGLRGIQEIHAWSRFHLRYCPMPLGLTAFEKEMAMFLAIFALGTVYGWWEGAFYGWREGAF